VIYRVFLHVIIYTYTT